MKIFWLPLLACVSLTACGSDSAPDQKPDSSPVATSASKEPQALTPPEPETAEPASIPQALVAKLRSLKFCTLAFEGTDAIEGRASLQVSNSGVLSGLNELLKVPASLGSGQITDASATKTGFDFKLGFTDGKTFPGSLSTEYGSTSLSLNIGSATEYVMCLESEPEVG